MVSFSLSHTHTHQRLFPKNQTLSYGSLQSNKEISIANRRKLNELQENSERQFTFNDVRNKTNEQKKYFAKDIETLKRNQKEILELKNSISKDKE